MFLMLDPVVVAAFTVAGLALAGMLGRAGWVLLHRRNNPTWPDHRRLDDGELAYEHTHGRLHDIPLRRR